MSRHRPRRAARAGAAAVIAGLGFLASACGTQHVSVGPAPLAPSSVAAVATVPVPVAPTAPTAAPTSVPPTASVTTVAPPARSICTAGDLRADQVPISAGTSQYYVAWSLTDTAATPCSLPAGRPSVVFADAAGTSLVSYQTTPLAGAPATALVIAPGHAVWFLTEQIGASCPAPVTVTGGPFHYALGLPGGATVDWAPGYLAATSLSNLCDRVPLAVGNLQASRPTA
jgi:hypothetical protein